jgi:UDP:flavonoid glycosyltransferase YjiC (YdhE family)
LLTRHAEHLPANLPETIRHVPFAPFRRLLPNVAALIHHGGIGSTAQALRAGIPQIIRPLAYDQPDNAERVSDLGVARTLYPDRFRAPIVASALHELLNDVAVSKRCRELATRVRADDGIENACNEIEMMRART